MLTYLQRLTPPQSWVPKVTGYSFKKVIHINCMEGEVGGLTLYSSSWDLPMKLFVRSFDDQMSQVMAILDASLRSNLILSFSLTQMSPIVS